MPSGQPTLLQKSSKCLQILAKITFLYAIRTTNLASKVVKMLANIRKNGIPVCPRDNQRCFKNIASNYAQSVFRPQGQGRMTSKML